MANTYKSTFFSLTTTNQTTVYTVPTGVKALVKTIQCSNHTGNTTVEVFVTDTSASTTTEIAELTMAASTTENFAKGPIVLDEGDILKITADTANRITGTVSILEVSYE
jgi:transcription antitermination factor NusA-like protein